MKRLPQQEATGLLSRLEWDASLSEITRTPLLLAATIRLMAEHAAIPASRFGLLQGLIDSAEKRSSHHLALRHGPLGGFAREYLEDLAGEMGRQGAIWLGVKDAREIVAQTNVRIKDHRDNTKGSTADLVGELVAHHLLVSSNVNDDEIIGFIHEQIQEWFGACFAKRQLRESESNEEKTGSFQELFINQPMWEQELLLLAEALCEQGATGIAAGTELARLALAVDPVFAGKLARLGSEATWQILGPDFEARLRAWYQRPGHMHRERALAAMIATGQATFADLIAPLVASEDQQVRLTALRVLEGEFSPRVLGENWCEEIRGWSVECRQGLVGELARSANKDAYALVADLARSDPVTEVRIKALESLAFWGRTEAVTVTLKEAPSDLWHELIRRGHDWIIPEVIEAGHRDMLIAFLREQSIERPIQTLEMLLYLQDRGFISIDEIASVSEFTRMIDASAERAYHLFGELARSDPGTVASRLVAELEAGRRLPAHIDPDLILAAAPEEIDQLFRNALDIEAGRLDEEKLKPVVNALTVKHWQSLVEWFRRLSIEIERSPRDRSRESLSEAYHDAQDLLKQAAPETLLVELTRVLKNELEFPLWAVTDLLAGLGSKDGEISALHHTRRAFAEFRQTAERIVDLILETDDPSGTRAADMARFVGAFAPPSGVTLWQRLLDRERQRLAARDAAFSQRSSPEAQRLIREGAIIWSHWYVKALCELDPPDRDARLEQLLEDPQFEADAAAALIREHRAWLDPEPTVDRRGRGYADVSDARERLAEAGRQEPHPIIRSLRDRLSVLLERNAAGNGMSKLRRRQIALAERLATARHPSVTPVVLEALKLADPKYGRWTIVRTVKCLVLDGHIVPADRAAALMDSILDCWLADKFHDTNDAYLLMEIPSLLLYTTSPETAVPRLHRLLQEGSIPGYLLRDFCDAAGWSGSPTAVKLLLELGPGRHAEHEWIWAVSRLGGIEAEDAFLDLMLDPPPATARIDSWTASAPIADLARRSDRLRRAMFAACAGGSRGVKRPDLSANVLKELDCDEAALAALGLIADADRPSVPPAVVRLLEERFVQREQQSPGSLVFQLRPRARPALRAALFKLMKDDPDRCRSALDLLVQLDRWRDQYGKPLDEPRHPDIRSGISWPPV